MLILTIQLHHKIFTCHDDWVVVTCSKLWYDRIIIFNMMLSYILQNLGCELIKRWWKGSLITINLCQSLTIINICHSMARAKQQRPAQYYMKGLGILNWHNARQIPIYCEISAHASSCHGQEIRRGFVSQITDCYVIQFDWHIPYGFLEHFCVSLHVINWIVGVCWIFSQF